MNPANTAPEAELQLHVSTSVANLEPAKELTDFMSAKECGEVSRRVLRLVLENVQSGRWKLCNALVAQAEHWDRLKGLYPKDDTYQHPDDVAARKQEEAARRTVQ